VHQLIAGKKRKVDLSQPKRSRERAKMLGDWEVIARQLVERPKICISFLQKVVPINMPAWWMPSSS